MHIYFVRKYQTVEQVIETVVKSHRELSKDEAIDFVANYHKDDAVEVGEDQRIHSLETVTEEEYEVRPLANTAFRSNRP